jgi:hypothetical protein
MRVSFYGQKLTTYRISYLRIYDLLLSSRRNCLFSNMSKSRSSRKTKSTREVQEHKTVQEYKAVQNELTNIGSRHLYTDNHNQIYFYYKITTRIEKNDPPEHQSPIG